MRILWPNMRQHFGIRRTVDEKNAAEQDAHYKPEDAPYLFQLLTDRVGATNSNDPASHDYRIAQLEALVASLAAQVAASPAVVMDYGMVVVAAGGTVHITLNKQAALTTYDVRADLYDQSGTTRLVAVPLIATPVDSRTKTGFDVDCQDPGFLFWQITKSRGT